MYGRFHRVPRWWDWGDYPHPYGPPPWACCWEEGRASPRVSVKERKAWLEAIKARLEARLEEVKAEIDALGTES